MNYINRLFSNLIYVFDIFFNFWIISSFIYSPASILNVFQNIERKLEQ